MADKDTDLGHVDMKEPDFPEIQRTRTYDRDQHIQKSIEAGLSPEEARRHADLHMRERGDEDLEEPGVNERDAAGRG